MVLHVAQLREAFAAYGADVWLLSRVNQRVGAQAVARIKGFAADGAFKGPLPRVAPHVRLEPLGAGVAPVAQGASERFVPRVRAEVSPELRGLEEAHVAVGAGVRLLRLHLVGPLVSFAVARLREALPADRAGEGLLPGVNALVTEEFVKFTECLHTERTLMGHLGFF